MQYASLPYCAFPFLSHLLALAASEAHPRPVVVDGADLVVDKAVGQALRADELLRQVGGERRGLLGPHDLETAVFRHGALCDRETPADVFLRANEQQDAMSRTSARTATQRRPLRQWAKRLLETIGRVEKSHAAARLDAELTRQRRTRIAGQDGGRLGRGRGASGDRLAQAAAPAPPGHAGGVGQGAANVLDHLWLALHEHDRRGAAGLAVAQPESRIAALRGSTGQINDKSVR